MDQQLIFFYGTIITALFVVGLIKYYTAVRKEQVQDAQNHYENWGN